MNLPVSELRQSPAACEPPAARFLLGAHRVIDIEGADAESFLQGQFCNDVVALGAGRAQINGYCTPKGRLLASFVLQRRPDGFRAVLPDAEVAQAFAKRLGMFVMRAAVTLRLRDDLVVIGLSSSSSPSGGDAVPASPAAGLPAWPGAVLDVGDAGEASLVRWHDDPVHGARALGVVAPDGAADAGLIDGEQAWRLGDIRAGLPSIRTGAVEAFVPQMVNFREIDALSFKKGCYPGQEIVARMHYLGKQKRHMRRVVAVGEMSDAWLPVPGQALGEGGAAQVVDAVATADGAELLVVVRIGALAQGLSLGHGAPVATDATLPYAPHVPVEEPAAGTPAAGAPAAGAPAAGSTS